jgi:hypothetical protein
MMAILINVKEPLNFLKKIQSAIDDKRIQTWTYDSENDFTHSLEQWKNKAWIRPYENITEKDYNIAFGFIGNTNVITTKGLYAVYHGRFVEILLTHFDIDIKTFLITSLPNSKYDNITYRE